MELTVGEIASQDYRKVEVFKKYGIDFCCGGKKTLSRVCEEKGISRQQLERELIVAENITRIPSQDFSSWSAGFLADYIVQTHHAYITRSIPLIFEYTQKVSRVHGGRNPETVETAKIFERLIEDLKPHRIKEEQVLFPYIRQMEKAVQTGGSVHGPFGTVKNPVNMMEHEHELIGELMLEIRHSTHEFTVPDHACNSYRYAYAKLQEFEADLNQHIHLENNILFPMAIQLEQELGL